MVLKNAQVVFIDEIKKCDLKIENGKPAAGGWSLNSHLQ